MKQTLLSAKRRTQTGSTLIEVLITMLITAIALLGIAGVQIRAQQEHRIAHLRMIAIEKGNQILEEARNTYRLSRDGHTAFVEYPGYVVAPPADACGLDFAPGSPCSAVDMWDAALSYWLTDLSNRLPNPAAKLGFILDQDPSGALALGLSAGAGTLDIPAHSVLTVTVAWKEPQVDSAFNDVNCALSGDADFTASVRGYRCVFLTSNL